ncbi:mitochondrial import inner membrane translocase subunit Tim8 A-like [Hylaeus volcanicus]|uniref:mitochondrial import inner membrane translocase subunit Tim8 A-like n=1 Tax=Hylaeus volcanicus TaxID=313075 RepID=UPI0023B77BAF|nr:mitochondrial import inner membrane translocase subunit Tim8 A-like [Hylaeus volcanicus]
MSFMEEQRSQGVVDEQIQAFIETEAKKQQFQELTFHLTGICWEICVGRPEACLNPKVEKCFINCVDRFIDTTNFITNRLERVVLNNYSKVDVQ